MVVNFSSLFKRSKASGALIVAIGSLSILWWIARSMPSIDSTNVIVVFALPFIIAIIVGWFVLVGLLGWLAFQFVRILLRMMDKKPEDLSKTGITIFVLGVVVFAVPEIWDKLKWWHEHALQFVPGETKLLDRIGIWLRDLSDDDRINLIGWAAIGPVATLVGVYQYPKFEFLLRRHLSSIAGKLFGQLRLVTYALGIVVLVSVAGWAYTRSDAVAVAGVTGLYILLGWLCIPDNFSFREFAAKAMLALFFLPPAFALASPISKLTNGWVPEQMAFVIVLIAWPASVVAAYDSPVLYRVVGWVGVVAIAGLMAAV
jgi:hypothetical protein